jgi:hypothetical protein
MTQDRERDARRIARLKILGDARAEFARMERELLIKEARSPGYEARRAMFFVGDECSCGMTHDAAVILDQLTALLAWPLVKAIIEREYRKAGGR